METKTLREAAQDVLEWAAQMGGWEAPCWARLKEAVEADRLRAEAKAALEDSEEYKKLRADGICHEDALAVLAGEMQKKHAYR